MLTLLRAAFWIAVVAYFMPGDPMADALTGSAREMTVSAAETTQDDMLGEVVALCTKDPDLCLSGARAVDDAQDLAVQGLDALAAALAEDRS